MWRVVIAAWGGGQGRRRSVACSDVPREQLAAAGVVLGWSAGVVAAERHPSVATGGRVGPDSPPNRALSSKSVLKLSLNLKKQKQNT